MPEFNQKKALEVLTPQVQELQNNKGEQVTNNSTQDEQEDEKKERHLATELRDLILNQKIEFAIDEVKKPYAKIKIADHYEIHAINSQSFKDIMIELAEKKFERVISKATLESALESISAKARRSKNFKPISIRVKYLPQEQKIYLDLCNDAWEIVEISKDGWQVLSDSPIWFKRTDDMDELPQPKYDTQNKENLNRLKKYINYSTDNNFDLYVSWLLSNLLTDTSVPILILQGSAGVGKSFTSELLRTIIDPVRTLKSISRVKPKMEEIVLDTSKNRILVYDNLSAGTITAELSDLFATIATNSATSKRALYTDDGQVIVKLGRSLLFNGIDDLVKRQDLLSRSIVVELEELKERKAEQELRKGFELDHPFILGALLNVASMALKNQGKSNFNKSRFTDWGRFVEDGSTSLDWEADHFSTIYLNNISQAQETLIQSNYFILGLIEILDQEYTGSISYYAVPLIDKINSFDFIPNNLPNGIIPHPQKIKERLNRDKALLNQSGISWKHSIKAGKTLYTFKREKS
ncbi:MULTISPECIES: hypothetical protein [unclassified Lactococcus]|uniref:hypothetical protein n=1 Tax=unclassified Lactococcus TaxID=2643510 RepID=UPI0011C8F93A|nr:MULTISPECIES: hypothetical protein [unclassified Lactococcus]MQW23952.1 hypothetical protein [Lactococcus sp. dk101]TXK36985.1 hypothetical protein FVP42_10240 [Lactococcus sp. dk310]TXK47610.1 hypothetical protein FVP43_09945 [Lactococcus sp. dk322]